MRRTQRTTFVSALVAALSLLLATAALADNVVNEFAVDSTDSIIAGETTTVRYKINGTGGDGQTGCNASDGSAATVTITVPAGVTASASSLTFTACNAFQNVTFGSNSAGNYAITHAVSDSGVGSYTNHANWTLNVSDPPPSDTTGPSVTCTPASSDGVWHASNQSVQCTATDPSGLHTTTPSPQTLSTAVTAGAENSNASTGTYIFKDIHGNTTQAGPITGWKIDRKAPTSIMFSGVPTTPVTLNASLPTVTCTATDGGSGLAGCAVTNQGTASVGTKIFTGTATDNVGNSDSATASYSVVYAHSAFAAPMDREPVINKAKAGRTLPLKFSVSDANNIPVLNVASATIKVSVANCSTGAATDAVETYTDGASGFVNNLDGTYQYDYKSPSTFAGSCRVVQVVLPGGGGPQTLVNFTK